MIYFASLSPQSNFTDPLGLIPSTTGACGQLCAGGESGISHASEGLSGSTSAYFESFEELLTALAEAGTHTNEAAEPAEAHSHSQPSQTAAPPAKLPPPTDDAEVDARLTATFNNTGQVVGANGVNLIDYSTGLPVDNHAEFAISGVVHTTHIVGNGAGYIFRKNSRISGFHPKILLSQ
jgi:hypothetical protein